jgi:hypothetical protein
VNSNDSYPESSGSKSSLVTRMSELGESGSRPPRRMSAKPLVATELRTSPIGSLMPTPAQQQYGALSIISSPCRVKYVA